jgi:hypothetical protein
MKILVGSSAPPDGGAGISSYARSLAECLVSLGHEVHYVSPAPENHEWLDQHGIQHVVTNQDLDALGSARALLD